MIANNFAIGACSFMHQPPSRNRLREVRDRLPWRRFPWVFHLYEKAFPIYDRGFLSIRNRGRCAEAERKVQPIPIGCPKKILKFSRETVFAS